jgi:ketosteroid isomerase-like protein
MLQLFYYRRYVDFVRAAAVKECTLDEPTIHVAGDTAVATCRWSMRWERDGRESTESGFDVFAFTRAEGRWLACWRALLPG